MTDILVQACESYATEKRLKGKLTRCRTVRDKAVNKIIDLINSKTFDPFSKEYLALLEIRDILLCGSKPPIRKRVWSDQL